MAGVRQYGVAPRTGTDVRGNSVPNSYKGSSDWPNLGLRSSRPPSLRWKRAMLYSVGLTGRI